MPATGSRVIFSCHGHRLTFGITTHSRRPIRIMLLSAFQTVLRLLDRVAAVLPSRKRRLSQHLLTGRSGEEEAYFYLRRQGYVIVARNFRSRRRRGEVDLIGWDGDVLCFIEVKTRTSRDVKPPEAAVDEAKRRELTAVARDYWRAAARSGNPPRIRFDILSIYYASGNNPQITLFKNAFSLT
jgi:putative endonuclease